MPTKSVRSYLDKASAILVNPRVVSAIFGSITMVSLYLLHGYITGLWG